MDVKSVSGPSSFTFPVWAGTIGGSALSTDPSPNVTPPAANRIVRYGSRTNRLTVQGSGQLRAIAVGGTTISFQPWYFDDFFATWIALGVAVTLTSANTTVTLAGISLLGGFYGAQFFMQITANTGVQAFGYDAH